MPIHAVGEPVEPPPPRVARVAVVCDFAEENWPSMDLVGDMIYANLAAAGPNRVQVGRLRPAMRLRAASLPFSGRRQWGWNADRFLNRFWDYDRFLRSQTGRFDLFHIVDHSYAQLAHAIPRGRALITCHDLDAFRCLLQPANEPRSAPFRWMTERTLSGLRRAAAIACASAFTARQLIDTGWVSASKVHVVPNGVHPAFQAAPDPGADRRVEQLLGAPQPDKVELLHVGSTIARKRVDVLLEVLAQLTKVFPNIRLLRVGGQFDESQLSLAQRRGVLNRIEVLPFLEPAELAAVYRRADLVVIPSEREGFGLPVVESMACGTPVVASDLEVLREVGGPACYYCGVGDIASWTGTITELLHGRRSSGPEWQRRRDSASNRAMEYSWGAHAEKLLQIYTEVLKG